jgi:peptidoglycan/LPS O-acetylase OafA/YrhL
VGTRHRDARLDGLRGSAAVAVVYVHYLFYSELSSRPGGGQVGVLVFFVLSGYLITRALLRGSSDDLDSVASVYGGFVRRRLLRLYPALIGVVVIGAPAMAYVGPENAGLALRGALVVLAQLMAFFYLSHQMPLEAWLPTWSLSVEWIFYLTWPLLLLAAIRRGVGARTLRRFALGSAVLLYLISMPLSPRSFYLLPPANLAVMLVGAALALGHAMRAEGRPAGRDAGIADLAFLLFVAMVALPSDVSGSVLYRVSFFPVAVVAAYVVIDERPGTGGIARRILESRPMTTLGLVSYSLYLWHLPVLWIVWWGLPDLSPAARCGIALVAVVPVVFLSFTFLEKPWLMAPGGREASTRPDDVQAKRIAVTD